ncbi:M14 family zinc carboxypeptidase [Cohaesibacter celericrescens]|uniref:Peptidase M14 domain-containing protein n=1 Tax=Cohaesibacter celericrescens TaxID=2067669 RepID=A0A2N5XLL8_9HYPH|nr:M14 family zinc carboxypeptidase [Cohaesibacter celericrescens]PLW75393.1 hypothetical protein C0081_20215 [Cohaesibacter celericrescens]
MTTNTKSLYRHRIDASLPLLVNRFSMPDYNGATVELWVFDSMERRRAAETRLKHAGVEAHIYSAYKPLIHALLEDVMLEGATDIILHYPVIEGASKVRFLLEAYPALDVIANLAGVEQCRFEATAHETGPIAYRIDYMDAAGVRQEIDIFAPNRVRDDHTGKKVLSSCGWIRVQGARDHALDCDEAYVTDQEVAFTAIMHCLQDQTWVGDAPYFDRLNMKISAPFYDQALPLEGEWISTAEAMHEDLYFSALELLKVKQGLEETERTFGPGQLTPMVVCSDSNMLEIELETVNDPHLAQDCSDSSDAPLPSRVAGWCLPVPANPGAFDLVGLSEADHWLAPETIKFCLDQLGGDPLTARSQRGRPVWARHIAGNGPALMITSGQHSNETTGPVGALRAAAVLQQNKHAFSIAPLINPDGFALFRELCQDFPQHMNHAARYTAGGNDLEYVARGFENDVQYQARALTDANLHLNLHGYPSHEWTRPFTGYVPRGMESWTVPKGFMLIVRYKSGWKAQANAILYAMIDVLARFEPLVAMNRDQLDRHKHYTGGDVPFATHKDIAFLIDEVSEGVFPITIITEAPDETVYGERFKLQHTAQMISVLSAAEASKDVLQHTDLP